MARSVNFVSRMSAGRLGLSKCASDYLSVLVDPFSGKTACVPSEFNFPSMKHFVRAYGTFNTGTAGLGYVVFAPFKAGWNGWSTNSAPIAFSGLAFTGTSINTPPATGVGEAQTNSPYNAGANAQSVEIRLVAAGIRVRNTTSLLNRGGTLVGVETLNHTSLGAQDVASVMLQDTSSPLPHTSGEWNCVTYHPEDPVEIQWISAGTAATGVYSNPFLGFLVNNNTSAQTFEYECCAVFESKGTLVHGLKPSISDPTGFADVQNIISSPEARKPYTETYGSWSRLASKVGAAVGVGVNAYQAYANQRNRAPPINQRISYGVPIIEEID
jgi:hypothetical protein